MGVRPRFFTLSTSSVSTWFQFAAGVLLLIVIAAAIDFANPRAGVALTGRLLSALVYALEVCAVAGIGASLLWLVKRAVVGKHAVQDYRDSVLWSACLIAGVAMIARIML